MSKTSNETIVQGADSFPTMNYDFFSEIGKIISLMSSDYPLTENYIADDSILLEDDRDGIRFMIKISALSKSLLYTVTNLTNDLTESDFTEIVETLNNYIEDSLNFSAWYDVEYEEKEYKDVIGIKKNNQTDNNMNNEKEQGLNLAKIHFEVLEINPKVKYGDYIEIDGNHQYVFNFKNYDEAEKFYMNVIDDTIKAGTFNTKAIAEIGNEILRHF